MGTYVVDASVAIKWVLNEDGSIEATELLNGSELYAPPLLMTEAANALWVVARCGVISGNEAQDALTLLGRAPFADLPNGLRLIPQAFDLARLLNHPVYDCTYLALGLELNCPVVTADRRFVRAAQQVATTASFVVELGTV